MLRNNIIAIIAISFVTVGGLWGIGNLLNSPQPSSLERREGILLVAKDNLFNETNPTIYAKIDEPTKLTVVNKDLVRHDFVVDALNINTAILSPEQDAITAIASEKAGEFEYYCSLHPATMRGSIVVRGN
ncbi:MAG: cupredoxin domain-containing protein [Nitrososphaeraceae archaeon]